MAKYTPQEIRKDREKTARFHVTRAMQYVEIGHLGLAISNLEQAARYLRTAEAELPSTITNQDAVTRSMALGSAWDVV